MVSLPPPVPDPGARCPVKGAKRRDSHPCSIPQPSQRKPRTYGATDGRQTTMNRKGGESPPSVAATPASCVCLPFSSSLRLALPVDDDDDAMICRVQPHAACACVWQYNRRGKGLSVPIFLLLVSQSVPFFLPFCFSVSVVAWADCFYEIRERRAERN